MINLLFSDMSVEYYNLRHIVFPPFLLLFTSGRILKKELLYSK